MKFLGVPSSGSIAGTTSSHNRAGQYTRNRRAPVQPIGTGRRAFIRSSFGAASSAYAGLTGAEQAAWASYANSYPITDALGQSIKLTGQQMYVAINTQLLNCTNNMTSTPPASPTVFAEGAFTITATHLGVIGVTDAGAGGAADFTLISFAAPQSGGRSFVSAFWQAFVIAGNNGVLTACGPAFVAQYGLPVVGQRIFCKLTPVNQYGVTGTPVIQFATVS